MNETAVGNAIFSPIIWLHFYFHFNLVYHNLVYHYAPEYTEDLDRSRVFTQV